MFFINVVKLVLRLRRLTGLTFVDMDNTLLPFVEERWQKKAYPLLEIDKPWVSSLPSDAIVLSKYSSWKEKRMKKKWLRHYFPRNMFILTRISKAKTVPPRYNFLLDDYNNNLLEWRKAGGISIKYDSGTNFRNKEYHFVHWEEDEDGISLVDDEQGPIYFERRRNNE